MTQPKDALNLPRSSSTWPLSARPKVRWLGADGGARTGVEVAHMSSGMTCAIDLLRQEVTYLEFGEYEIDTRKDDEGNAK